VAELTLEEKKRAIWEDVSSSFSMCQVITDFPSQLIHNEDLPRLIYKGKAVLSDNLFEKIDFSKINLDLFYVICQGLVIAKSMILGLNEKYSIICADSYCCVRFKRNELKSTQFEQTYFSKKFISLFSVDKIWDSDNEEIQIFVKDMFGTIIHWQENPELHKKEINIFSEEILTNKI